MDQFLSFVMENWRFLVEVILTLVVLLIAIFKKKASVNIPDSMYQMIPSFIEDAERIFGSGEGEKKLHYVVECCLRHVQSVLGIDVSNKLIVLSSIVEQVEEILGTPKKKETEK